MSWRDKIRTKAQGMVEFALILPILLILVIGIIELGRLLFIFSSVTTSAREATRYGSASGDAVDLNNIAVLRADGTPLKQYEYCLGIRTALLRGTIVNTFPGDLNHVKIVLQNETPTTVTEYGACQSTTATYNQMVEKGTTDPYDRVAHFQPGSTRISVYVCADYQPVVPLVPISPRLCSAGQGVRSESHRTIMGTVSLDAGAGGPVGPTSTKTLTPTSTGTATRTATSTATLRYTYTPTRTSTSTPTLRYTYTPTRTGTPTQTGTPTATSTPPMACYVSYQIESSTQDVQFDGKIVLRNNLAATNWVLTFMFPGDQHILSVDTTGVTTGQVGRNVTMTGANVLASGESQEIIFHASFHGTNIYPYAFFMNGQPCEIPPLPDGQCDVRHNQLTTSPFQMTVYNNSRYAVKIDRIVINWNDSPTSQSLTKLTFGGLVIYSGTSTAPPTNLSQSDFGSNVGIANASSALLLINFGSTYTANGSERITITFQSGYNCPVLRSSDDLYLQP